MSAPESSAASRIGRPPKVDKHGTPTRERLLQAAVEACVERGYEGATLSDIARRAEVSTPAVYSHFSGKAELLVEASQHELDKLSSSELVMSASLHELARRWLQPDFANTRVLVAELHCAAIRQGDVAELLATWQEQTSRRLQRQANLTEPQVKLFYLFLIGLAHADEVGALPVTQHETEDEVSALLDGWFGARNI